ncbi:Ldh family oxidoreductase (plasmid) [Aminobacter sp. NyZ550]|jgi:(2R)-3-sulfolactate dehydrogenase (NADP+)|uniref:(2R)-3-sulfolactate dehydrogenase (NADP+) n=3 Tax=Phyllobacteriaceae TaxID=69277 RepID=A0AAC8YUF0_AMIAI|nr:MULTISPECIES: Ldh family oxidoreductase [Aminobacter]AMS44453.1 Malate/L-lactate dehydrogenase family protein [Aminobacter aminovorans]MBA8907701.1 (2R)-3-sulfolactate dehydrogenase (NADP+) [Aminobacter ciceronei]MBA9021449.1 (2R)-3-sulfolactate dehydrogenase (NADP+) [Aminobacter ciceronei]MBB3704273.1 (2R)-3-sulfolactate dehydrogenase (NADP+) [Aminobacter aminovorans]MRX32487.1 Ldh family oxidoreductase [Aminobacter sp. MDW-2]
MTERTMTLAAVEQLCLRALTAAGASEDNAAAVARSTMLAERDGIRSHGLLYVPIYADHVRCGKVDGKARPAVSQPRPGAVVVDAATGFAHPAIDAGWDRFIAAARRNGVAAMTVFNSYNCGVVGHHAERIAEAGLLGLCTTHAPASIAPPGGRLPVIGTNPFALGAPDGAGGAALVLDQSASVVAKSEILLRSREGRPIEPGWAIDEHGADTLDPAAALKGSMLPAGGHKGFGVGLLVEILASCLAGAVLSKDASPFSGTAGGPPRTGQCFIAFDPRAFSTGFSHQVASLVAAIANQGDVRLPGSGRQAARRRNEREGVRVDAGLVDRIETLCR